MFDRLIGDVMYLTWYDLIWHDMTWHDDMTCTHMAWNQSVWRNDSWFVSFPSSIAVATAHRIAFHSFVIHDSFVVRFLTYAIPIHANNMTWQFLSHRIHITLFIFAFAFAFAFAWHYIASYNISTSNITSHHNTSHTRYGMLRMPVMTVCLTE